MPVSKVLQNKLWPIIEATIKEAYFTGLWVIIDGKEMHRTLSPQEVQLTLSRMNISDFLEFHKILIQRYFF